MKSMLRFLLHRAVRNTLSSFSAFVISSLCLGIALFCATFYVEREIFLNSLVPTWARETKALVAISNNATPKQVEKVKAILKVSKWVKSFSQIEQAKAWERFLKDFSHLKDIAKDIDPIYIPLIFEVTLKKECLNSSGECSEFLAKLEGIPSVESVFSPLPWIRRIYIWFELFQKGALFFALFLFVCAMVITLLGIKLSFQASKREAYIFDILGASSWFIKLPFYFQGTFIFCVGLIISFAGLYGFCEKIIDCASITDVVNLFFVISALVFVCEVILIEFTVRFLRISIRKSDDLWMQ